MEKIASPVVFKIRIYNPNLKATASKNRSHIFYIAKRHGVSLNTDMHHGLFGKLDNNDFSEIRDIKKSADYVYQKTKDKTNVYRGIISLEESDALRLGYENKEDWQKLLQANIYDIAEKVGVSASKLEFVGAIHLDSGHFHVHYLFWDKEQGVKKPWISPRLADEIRISLTKKIYKEELEELYQLKNEAREILTSDSDDFFKSFFEPFVATGCQLSPELLNDVEQKVFELKNKLPKTGRINYKFLPPEQKIEIENIIKE